MEFTPGLMLSSLLCGAALLSGHATLGAVDTVLPLGQVQSGKDAKMAWWREAKFGMFIHWGLYAQAGGEFPGYPAKRGNMAKYAEWLMNDAMIPVANYEQLAARFNPTAFDANRIAAVAKAAGMKYIVITAKHHEGFAMFRSAVDRYNIVDATPFKRDPLKELNEACQKQGLKLGFYYSQDLDWHAPGGGTWYGNPKWDPVHEGDFGTYFQQKALPQIKELLANYQPSPAILWFDMATNNVTRERTKQVMDVLKQYPQVLINERLGDGARPDYGVAELMMERSGATGVWRGDVEACDSINDTWGYSVNDQRWKSPQYLIHYLVNVISQGGNFLLNVGPDSTGAIPGPALERLAAIGGWMQVNGEAIYGAGPTVFGSEYGGYTDATDAKKFVPQHAWRCTAKPGRIYIHLLQWPGTSWKLTGLRQAVRKAYLLADPQRRALTFTQKQADFAVQLPAQAPDALDSVLTLELDPSSIIGPADPIVGVRRTSKGGPNHLARAGDFGGANGAEETPAQALDGNLATKYFAASDGGIDTGLIYTPASGPRMITAFRFATANDSDGRDPLTITIEGSNDPAASLPDTRAFTVLYEGSSGLDRNPGRSAWGETIAIKQTKAYKSYRILVTKTRDAGADAVQYAEVQFLPRSAP